ncbi:MULTISPECIES: preprotein translocase subunit SecE [unclassified Synechococcus]|uniref:preprotein translocase subunit SecE n=1 Tax=unclassified Synechococcus TaxID=2626047 RepID=UPI0018CEE565|nr:preprotein translocase subunit SecE [Synechococcus sp. CBW1002]QPN67819.1 preprotein translocase subunit SecE [Synechococcus sp. CBW1006]
MDSNSDPTLPQTRPTTEGGGSNAAVAEAPAATSEVAESEGNVVAATMAELRKVVWPSRQQLFSEAVAVILMVSLSAAAIAAIDRLYGWAATQVFR